MNHLFSKRAALFLLLPLLGAGCFANTEQPLRITPASVLESRVNDFAEDRAGCEVNLNYPIVSLGGSEKKAEAINQQIVGDLADSLSVDDTETLQVGIDGFLDECEDVLQDSEIYSNPWSFESTFDSYLYKNRYLSLTQDVFSYLGGAHPNTIVLTHLFDLETGNQLGFTDIVSTDKQDAFIERVLVHQLNESVGILDLYPGVQQSIESGRYEDLAQHVEVFFADDGLHLFFNAYVIAPYVVGPIEIVVPLKQAGEYLQI